MHTLIHRAPGYTGFPAVPQAHQIYSGLRAFTQVAPSAWKSQAAPSLPFFRSLNSLLWLDHLPYSEVFLCSLVYCLSPLECQIPKGPDRCHAVTGQK